MTTGEFFARLYLYSNEPYDFQLEVWDNELEPMDGDKCPVSVWAGEYLHNLNNKDFRELLKLPAEGAFQAVFSGIIRGWWSNGYEYNEWEEEIDEITTCEFAEIPEAFLKTLDEDQNGLELD